MTADWYPDPHRYSGQRVPGGFSKQSQRRGRRRQWQQWVCLFRLIGSAPDERPASEENQYYPFGLPMGDMAATADGFLQNRDRYQSNAYIKDSGLNWMDFHARQYDPQTGRFLGVDPLADGGGQERFSPYAAMGNNPAMMVDPEGMQFQDMVNLPPRDLLEPIGGFHPSSLSRGTAARDALNEQMASAAAREMTNNFWTFVARIFMQTTGNSLITNNGDGSFNVNFVYNSKLANDYSNNSPSFTKNVKTFSGGKNFHILAELFEKSQIGGTERSGMRINIHYSGSFDEYEEINWVQTIIGTSDHIIDISKDWRQDGAAPPFYYLEGEAALRLKFGGNLDLDDFPNRPSIYQNYYWLGYSSLVGYRNGNLHVFGTFAFGYINVSGMLFFIPPAPVSNSRTGNEHLNYLNNLKK